MNVVLCWIGNAEEHASLSRALSQLAEVEEKIEQIHIAQVLQLEQKAILILFPEL